MSTIDLIPTGPGRLPLGHLVSMGRDPLAFFQRQQRRAPITKIYIGTLPAYMVSGLDLTRELMVARGASVDKGVMFDRARAFFGEGLLTSGGELHRRQRRLIQPAFHQERIVSYAAKMSALIDHATWSWQDGQVLKMDEIGNALSIATITDTLFSSRLDEEMRDRIRLVLPAVLQGAVARLFLPVWMQSLPVPGKRRFDNAVRTLHSIIQEIVEMYGRDHSEDGTLLQLLLDARETTSGADLTDSQINDELTTMLVAGSETVGSVFAWVLHHACEDTTIGAKLRAEATQVLDGRAAEFGDIAQLEYTQRVVREALRLYCPWIMMRRSRVPVTLGGTRFPADSEFVFSIYAMHRDPDLFSEPERFNPDRWLVADELPRDAHSPFGMGGRKCIGENFAWVELVIAIATIFDRWQLEPLPGHRTEQLLTGPQPRVNSLPLQVRRLRSQPHGHGV